MSAPGAAQALAYVVNIGGKSVQVAAKSVIRVLRENTLPEDVVPMKVDIEGSEWDIVRFQPFLIGKVASGIHGTTS